MLFHVNSYIVPLILAALLSAFLSVYSWRRRSAPGAYALSAITAAVAAWLLGYAFEIAADRLASKLFWATLQYPSIVFLPVGWLIFVQQYVQRHNRVTRYMLLLAVVPLLTLALVLTNGWHGLIWQSTTLDASAPFLALDVAYGPWFWVHSVYSYLLLLAGSVLLLREVLRQRQQYRWQAASLLIAALAPWLGNMAYLLRVGPFHYLDGTPFGFALTGLLLTLSLFSFHLLDLIPIARTVVLEHMRDGVIVLDVQHRLTDINPAAAALFNCRSAQVLGQPAATLLGEQFTAALTPQHDADWQGLIVLGAGAEQRDLEVRASLLHDQRQRAIGRLLVLRDVTATRRAEEARRKLTALIEYSSDFIGIADLDGRIIFLNQSGCQLVGLADGNAACTHTLYDVIAVDDRPFFQQQIVPQVLRDGAWSGEIEFQHFGGAAPIPMQFSLFVVRDGPVGAPLALASVSRDSTERKRAEQQLRVQAEIIAEQHRRLQVVVSAIGEGVMLIGGDRRVLVINQAALRLLSLGGKPEDWVDRPIEVVIETLEQLAPLLGAAAQSELRRVDGGDIQTGYGEHVIGGLVLAWQSIPLRPDTRGSGRVIVLRDVTEERALERMRNDLTHTMVHDLRNPLTAIQGVLDVVRTQPGLNTYAHELLQVAVSGSSRMLKLVSAILDVNRLESGQMPLQLVALALPALVVNSFKQLQPLSDAKRLRLQCVAPDALPQAWADPTLLDRVFQNLLGNAITFTPEQGTITVTIVVCPEPVDHLLVSISDSGPGIPADVRDRLFQKFATGSNHPGGSGLGLAFCKLVVEAHGGQIWLERPLGPGTTFSFTVPTRTASTATRLALQT